MFTEHRLVVKKCEDTYRSAASISSSVLPSLGHVRNPLLIRKILPDLGNLFNSVLPLWMFHLQVCMIDVGVENHGDGGVLSLRFVSLPLLHVLLSRVLRSRGPAVAAAWSHRVTGLHHRLGLGLLLLMLLLLLLHGHSWL